MTPDGPPVPDEPPSIPFTGSTHLLLFEAECSVAIATAGRTSGQCYCRVPRFRGRAVAIRERLTCQQVTDGIGAIREKAQRRHMHPRRDAIGYGITNSLEQRLSMK